MTIDQIKEKMDELDKEIKESLAAFVEWDIEIDFQKALKIIGPEKCKKLLENMSEFIEKKYAQSKSNE